jgi:type I restriction enzyme R subunit
MAKKEAQARIRINRLLEQVGWRFFPDKDGPDNIICECRTTKKTYSPNALGDDFEKTSHGFVDYVLLNLERKPVSVVEAKREETDPLDAKEQARDYAKSLGVRHIFLSNGQLQYYWDLTQERALVEANRELAVRFEQKLQTKLSEIWGTEAGK